MDTEGRGGRAEDRGGQLVVARSAAGTGSRRPPTARAEGRRLGRGSGPRRDRCPRRRRRRVGLERPHRKMMREGVRGEGRARQALG